MIKGRSRSPIYSEPQLYVPGVIGSGGNPTKGTTTRDRGVWWREGKFMCIRWEYVQTVAGAAGTGTYSFPIPDGHLIDTSIQSADFAFPRGVCGSFNMNLVGNNFVGTALVATNNQIWAIYARTGDATGTVQTWSAGASAFNNATIDFTFDIKIPILGWSTRR
jgi:hypothetical protein